MKLIRERVDQSADGRTLKKTWTSDVSFEENGRTYYRQVKLVVSHDKNYKRYSVRASISAAGGGWERLIVFEDPMVSLEIIPAPRFSAKKIKEIFEEYEDWDVFDPEQFWNEHEIEPYKAA